MIKKLFPVETVIKTRHFCVNQDWEVPIPGFFIIAPNRKIRSVIDMTDEEALEFIRLLRKVRTGMKDVLNIKEVYLYQNEDSEFGFHLWIFPRYEWMEEFGRKIQSVRPIMNHAKENMITDDVIKEVKQMVEKMRKYMEGFI